MSDAVAVLWVGEGGNAAHDDASASRALAEWARARGIRIMPLDEATEAPRIDLTLADRVEKELDHAREALASTDADSAERALARADALLREHPELPQAAWLRAEAERMWSQRWLRVEPRDEARARTAWENAQALDGGRASGIGETAFPPRAKITTTIVVNGSHAERVTLRLDGHAIAATESNSLGATYKVEIAPAEHHLHAMTEAGRVVFASWVSIIGTSPPKTSIAISDASACSREELRAVHRGEDNHIVADGVTCDEWIAAVRVTERPGTVLVSRCERDVCGPLLEWRVERYGTVGPPQPTVQSTRWPAWATWTLLGIGAATVTSVALIATGVFEPRPVEPRFTIGGARQN